MSSAALAALTLATPAIVQARQPTFRFDIPAQGLGSALRTFGQVTNQQIIFSEGAVRGKLSQPLRGMLTADDGLTRLVEGSELAVSRTNAGMLVVGYPNDVTQSPYAAVVDDTPISELVVTGSRIRQTDPETVAPVAVATAAELTERGYDQLGDLLNQNTSNTPTVPIATTQGLPVLTAGRQSPNLFNLGPGRTLSLVNGRRMVTSGSGLGDRTVDANLIPAGLLQQVEIVQAGGAAVYGSDAIAGVVNYVLKTDFDGLELDAKYGLTARGDYPQPAWRITAGRNLASGRANLAADLEWSRTGTLLEYDRPFTASAPRPVSNPLNTGPADGQPPTVMVFNARSWLYNPSGVLFTSNTAQAAALLQVGGRPAQISADGLGIAPYDTGAIQGGSVAIGGDGFDPRLLSSLAAEVERYSAALVGHYDLTGRVRLSGEAILSEAQASEPFGTQSIVRFIGGSAPSGQGPISFTRANPFLTAGQVATLSAASPTFAAGGPLYLSRFLDILPTRARDNETRTAYAAVSLAGDFDRLERTFYWSASLSRGRTEGHTTVWAPWTQHMTDALNAVRNPSGQIVCAINADAATANDDAACAPLNPFGHGTASEAARAYVSALSGSDYTNIQDDFLATIGGDLAPLPAGKAQFSLAYERRAESVEFAPFATDQAGIFFSGTRSLPISGDYHTDEFSAEVLLPLLGEGFTLPLVEKLEASGSLRDVNHSIAGREQVWGAGLRLQARGGLVFRTSHSRNFRAPTLDQQFAPSTVNFNFIGSDPCDADRVNGGPSPAVRLANCQREFATHPGYGPLASFQDPAESTSITAVTTGGNPDLRNETSDTVTLGMVFQPAWLGGLSFSADRVSVDLTDGLSAFTPASFLAVCYDTAPQPADFCDGFTRDATGTVVAARQTTFNAGLVQYRGEVYSLSYRFALGAVAGRDFGSLELAGEATHTTRLSTSVTGFDRSRSDGTAATPDWRARFDARYARGPLRVFYSIYYLPEVKSGFTDTIETTPYPLIAANAQHTLSAQYAFGRFLLRGGVNNLTDAEPSFPNRSYGDLFGRRYFIGLRARY